MWKEIGSWTFGLVGKFPTIAAQKEKYETQIMLLNAEHKNAMEKLEAENHDLRAKVEPLTQQLKQCQHAFSFLQEKLRQYEDAQSGDPPTTGASVGGL